jgi:autotransporter-associated beta strand protein
MSGVSSGFPAFQFIMKARSRFRHVPLWVAATGLMTVNFMAVSIAATSHYWNVGGTGGDGIWGTSPGDKNWNLVVGAPTGNTFWPDTIDDVAVFQNAIGGSVTVFDPVQATGIIQNGASYTVNAGTITLVQDSALNVPSISVQSGVLTIDSVLAGTDGLTKTGRGDLLLSGTNIYTGTTKVTAGTLTLAGSLASEALHIDRLGTLVDQAGGLATGTGVTNSGTLTVVSPETVQSYTQLTDGRLTSGAALTVTGVATLDGGTVGGSLRGDTNVTGIVFVSSLAGSLGDGNLSITSGRLILEGTSTNHSVSISAGTSLSVRYGGLSSSAVVTNAGSFIVNSSNTVSAYTQTGTGSLSGLSSLTTTGGATLGGGTVSGNLRGDITTTGDVSVTGAIGGGTLSVTGGNLTLSGISTNRVVNIGASSSLLDFNRALDATAIVTNAGVLNVVHPDTIASYTQNGNGGIEGPGTLIVTGGATLNGGYVSAGLMGDTISTGNVLITGTLGGGTLSVASGNLVFSGMSENSAVNISAGASMVEALGGFAADAAVTNAGSLIVNGGMAVATYVQNGNGSLSGTETLTVFDHATLNGGTVHGTLLGPVTSTGTVLVSGVLGEGALSVTGGNLTLTGRADNGVVEIASGGTLRDVTGGLSSQAFVFNDGTLRVDAPDEVGVYSSAGGTLEGGGKFSAFTASLGENSSVVGRLVAQNLSTQGAVLVSGKAVAEDIRIESGILTNTGLLGSASAHLNINSGATLVAAGTQRYETLTTSGTGTGEWRGNLNNSATIVPGGDQGFGNLQVTGNFRNGSTGTLRMDVGTAGHDLLKIGGVATFGGALSLNQSGPRQIAPFIPVQLFDASSYKSNFTSLTENLKGTVFFNPENGTITRLGNVSGSGDFLSAVTRNQRSTWITLYDDVIDPDKTNVTRDPGAASGYDITGGMTDLGNPDLLRALAASLTPTGLDVELLNHLSAEVYASFSDYAMQATRLHQRTVLSAPALRPRAHGDSKSGPITSSKASAKDAISPTPAFGREWEFFAAVDYFHAETDNSSNHADYVLSGTGIVAGARNQLSDHFLLAAYLSADDGTIHGRLIDSDQSGWSLGLVGETVFDAGTRTLLTTAVSYGQFESTGTRQSAATTATGWTPGRVNFSDIDSSSLELYAGLQTTVYQNERFRVIPTAAMRYTSASMDGFSESTGSAVGSPIALNVRPASSDDWILEMGVAAEATLSEQLTFQGQLGFNAGIGNDSDAINSSFAKGKRTMSAEADGLTDNLFYLGLGLQYQVNGDFTVGLGYRSDFRPSHPIEQSCNISSAFRF